VRLREKLESCLLACAKKKQEKRHRPANRVTGR
jgi:hypothetical protein